jgi:hypothetical protein
VFSPAVLWLYFVCKVDFMCPNESESLFAVPKGTFTRSDIVGVGYRCRPFLSYVSMLSALLPIRPLESCDLLFPIPTLIFRPVVSGSAKALQQEIKWLLWKLPICF